jgi:Flp pilus assembly pilin Flp
MAQLFEFAGRLWVGENGATVVEYILLIIFMAMVCFTAVSLLGQSLIGPFQHAATGLS